MDRLREYLRVAKRHPRLSVGLAVSLLVFGVAVSGTWLLLPAEKDPNPLSTRWYPLPLHHSNQTARIRSSWARVELPTRNTKLGLVLRRHSCLSAAFFAYTTRHVDEPLDSWAGKVLIWTLEEPISSNVQALQTSKKKALLADVPKSGMVLTRRLPERAAATLLVRWTVQHDCSRPELRDGLGELHDAVNSFALSSPG